MSVLEQAPPEVLLQVQKVKDIGRKLRNENILFVEKAKIILKELMEDLKNFIKNESKDFNGEINLKNVEQFINSLKDYKENLTAKRKTIQNFTQNPTGKEKVNELISLFNSEFQGLKSFESILSIKIPWQIEMSSMIDPDNPQSINR
jgi:ribosomal protein S15P/S13E